MLGMRFSRLMVIAEAEPAVRPNGKTGRRWLCRCDCGVERVVRQGDLRTGNTRSCGCLYRESRHEIRRTHGQSDTRVYSCWVQMKQRCFNPKDDKFPDYGARGITVCAAWRDSFEAFISDMGPRPPGHTLDRIDNDGDYEPGNCRWATAGIQTRNKRNNIEVTWRGRKMILVDAIRAAGLPRKAVEHRLTRGWDLERALSTPIKG